MGRKDDPKHKKDKDEKPDPGPWRPPVLPPVSMGCPPHDPDSDDWSSDARCRRCGQPC